MKKSLYRLLIFVTAISLFSMIQCTRGSELSNGGGMGSGFTESSISSGTLTFFILSGDYSGATNLAYGKAGTKEDVHSLVITVTELEVHRTGDIESGWEILPLSGDSFDLIELKKTMWSDLLSSTNPETGEYNKIRLRISSAVVMTDNGKYTAEVPGDKININLPFSVNEDRTTEITVSIDPESSLKSTGQKDNPKYFLNPVLKISSKIED